MKKTTLAILAVLVLVVVLGAYLMLLHLQSATQNPSTQIGPEGAIEIDMKEFEEALIKAIFDKDKAATDWCTGLQGKILRVKGYIGSVMASDFANYNDVVLCSEPEKGGSIIITARFVEPSNQTRELIKSLKVGQEIIIEGKADWRGWVLDGLALEEPKFISK